MRAGDQALPLHRRQRRTLTCVIANGILITARPPQMLMISTFLEQVCIRAAPHDEDEDAHPVDEHDEPVAGPDQLAVRAGVVEVGERDDVPVGCYPRFRAFRG